MTAAASVRRPPALSSMVWLTIAVIGWTMVGWLAVRGFSAEPKTAAFDLELILRAGRNVAGGGSAYDPAIAAGTAPDAVGLFFSYPPIVAQALAPFAGVPGGVMFAAWSTAAVAALFVVATRLADRLGDVRRTAGMAAVGVAAITFPFVIAVLFGNVDAFFPALYGLALIAAVSPRLVDRRLGGVAIALGVVAKIYPVGLMLWFATRALRERRNRQPLTSLTTIVAFVVGAAVLFGASLLVGGIGPWQEYAGVLAAAGRAELVDPRNIGPAAQLALAVGGSSDVARLLHVVVLAAAVLGTIWAAWTRTDPVESLAIAAVCTLVILPVTWIHYPAALLPFGLVAGVRSRGTPAAGRVATLLGLSILLSVVALIWLPLLWVGVATLIATVHASSRPDTADATS